MFRLGLLQRALAQAGSAITDESSAVEALGLMPRLVPGEIGEPQTHLAGRLRARRPPAGDAMNPPEHRPALRIGEGWDTHALVAGRPLVLGGVTIPHSHGLLGHSDADALLHAITDALLGAAGLGDIGRHFPDTDPAYRGADSIVLLQTAAAPRARRRLAHRQYRQPPSSRRRRSWHRTSRRCANASPQRWGWLPRTST